MLVWCVFGASDSGGTALPGIRVSACAFFLYHIQRSTLPLLHFAFRTAPRIFCHLHLHHPSAFFSAFGLPLHNACANPSPLLSYDHLSFLGASPYSLLTPLTHLPWLLHDFPSSPLYPPVPPTCFASPLS